MSITKKAAKAITSDLDRLAQLFEHNHETIGVPAKVAVDFAYRCDLLSDYVEKSANLDRQDKMDEDTVQTQSDSDEGYMNEDAKEQTYLHELGDMVDSGNLENAAKLANLLAELLKTADEDEDDSDEDDSDDSDEEAGKKAADEEEAEEEEADEDEEAGKKAADEDEEAEEDEEADEDEEAGKTAKLVALAREILRVAGDSDEEAEEDEEADEDEEAGKKAAFTHGYDLNA